MLEVSTANKMDEQDERSGNVIKRLSVPVGLEELMSSLTKEILRKQPADIYTFASEYFAHLLTLRDSGNYQQPAPKSVAYVEKENSKKSLGREQIKGGKHVSSEKKSSKQVSICANLPTKSPGRKIKRIATPKLDRNSKANKRGPTAEKCTKKPISGSNKSKSESLGTPKPSTQKSTRKPGIQQISSDNKANINEKEKPDQTGIVTKEINFHENSETGEIEPKSHNLSKKLQKEEVDKDFSNLQVLNGNSNKSVEGINETDDLSEQENPDSKKKNNDEAEQLSVPAMTEQQSSNDARLIVDNGFNVGHLKTSNEAATYAESINTKLQHSGELHDILIPKESSRTSFTAQGVSDNVSQKITNAATTIQAGIRGHLTRRQYQERKKKTNERGETEIKDDHKIFKNASSSDSVISKTADDTDKVQSESHESSEHTEDYGIGSEASQTHEKKSFTKLDDAIKTENDKINQPSSKLQHSGELHDEVILKQSITENKVDKTKDTSLDNKIKEQTEETLQETDNLKATGLKEKETKTVLPQEIKNNSGNIKEQSISVSKAIVPDQDNHLQHSSEYHDNVIIKNPEPTTVNSISNNDKDLNNVKIAFDENVLQKSAVLQHSGELHDTPLDSIPVNENNSDEKQVTKTFRDPQDGESNEVTTCIDNENEDLHVKKSLQHSSEMHDIILPVDKNLPPSKQNEHTQELKGVITSEGGFLAEALVEPGTPKLNKQIYNVKTEKIQNKREINDGVLHTAVTNASNATLENTTLKVGKSESFHQGNLNETLAGEVLLKELTNNSEPCNLHKEITNPKGDEPLKGIVLESINERSKTFNASALHAEVANASVAILDDIPAKAELEELSHEGSATEHSVDGGLQEETTSNLDISKNRKETNNPEERNVDNTSSVLLVTKDKDDQRLSADVTHAFDVSLENPDKKLEKLKASHEGNTTELLLGEGVLEEPTNSIGKSKLHGELYRLEKEDAQNNLGNTNQVAAEENIKGLDLDVLHTKMTSTSAVGLESSVAKSEAVVTSHEKGAATLLVDEGLLKKSTKSFDKFVLYKEIYNQEKEEPSKDKNSTIAQLGAPKEDKGSKSDACVLHADVTNASDITLESSAKKPQTVVTAHNENVSGVAVGEDKPTNDLDKFKLQEEDDVGNTLETTKQEKGKSSNTKVLNTEVTNASAEGLESSVVKTEEVKTSHDTVVIEVPVLEKPTTVYNKLKLHEEIHNQEKEITAKTVDSTDQPFKTQIEEQEKSFDSGVLHAEVRNASKVGLESSDTKPEEVETSDGNVTELPVDQGLLTKSTNGFDKFKLHEEIHTQIKEEPLKDVDNTNQSLEISTEKKIKVLDKGVFHADATNASIAAKSEEVVTSHEGNVTAFLVGESLSKKSINGPEISKLHEEEENSPKNVDNLSQTDSTKDKNVSGVDYNKLHTEITHASDTNLENTSETAEVRKSSDEGNLTKSLMLTDDASKFHTGIKNSEKELMANKPQEHTKSTVTPEASNASEVLSKTANGNKSFQKDFMRPAENDDTPTKLSDDFGTSKHNEGSKKSKIKEPCDDVHTSNQSLEDANRKPIQTDADAVNASETSLKMNEKKLLQQKNVKEPRVDDTMLGESLRLDEETSNPKLGKNVENFNQAFENAKDKSVESSKDKPSSGFDVTRPYEAINSEKEKQAEDVNSTIKVSKNAESGGSNITSTFISKKEDRANSSQREDIIKSPKDIDLPEEPFGNQLHFEVTNVPENKLKDVNVVQSFQEGNVIAHSKDEDVFVKPFPTQEINDPERKKVTGVNSIDQDVKHAYDKEHVISLQEDVENNSEGMQKGETDSSKNDNKKSDTSILCADVEKAPKLMLAKTEATSDLTSSTKKENTITSQKGADKLFGQSLNDFNIVTNPEKEELVENVSSNHGLKNLRRKYEKLDTTVFHAKIAEASDAEVTNSFKSIEKANATESFKENSLKDVPKYKNEFVYPEEKKATEEVNMAKSSFTESYNEESLHKSSKPEDKQIDSSSSSKLASFEMGVNLQSEELLGSLEKLPESAQTGSTLNANVSKSPSESGIPKSQKDIDNSKVEEIGSDAAAISQSLEKHKYSKAVDAVTLRDELTNKPEATSNEISDEPDLSRKEKSNKILESNTKSIKPSSSVDISKLQNKVNNLENKGLARDLDGTRQVSEDAKNENNNKLDTTALHSEVTNKLEIALKETQRDNEVTKISQKENSIVSSKDEDTRMEASDHLEKPKVQNDLNTLEIENADFSPVKSSRALDDAKETNDIKSDSASLDPKPISEEIETKSGAIQSFQTENVNVLLKDDDAPIKSSNSFDISKPQQEINNSESAPGEDGIIEDLVDAERISNKKIDASSLQKEVPNVSVIGVLTKTAQKENLKDSLSDDVTLASSFDLSKLHSEIHNLDKEEVTKDLGMSGNKADTKLEYPKPSSAESLYDKTKINIKLSKTTEAKEIPNNLEATKSYQGGNPIEESRVDDVFAVRSSGGFDISKLHSEIHNSDKGEAATDADAHLDNTTKSLEILKSKSSEITSDVARVNVEVSKLSETKEIPQNAEATNVSKEGKSIASITDGVALDGPTTTSFGKEFAISKLHDEIHNSRSDENKPAKNENEKCSNKNLESEKDKCAQKLYATETNSELTSASETIAKQTGANSESTEPLYKANSIAAVTPSVTLEEQSIGLDISKLHNEIHNLDKEETTKKVNGNVIKTAEKESDATKIAKPSKTTSIDVKKPIEKISLSDSSADPHNIFDNSQTRMGLMTQKEMESSNEALDNEKSKHDKDFDGNKHDSKTGKALEAVPDELATSNATNVAGLQKEFQESPKNDDPLVKPSNNLQTQNEITTKKEVSEHALNNDTYKSNTLEDSKDSNDASPVLAKTVSSFKNPPTELVNKFDVIAPDTEELFNKSTKTDVTSVHATNELHHKVNNKEEAKLVTNDLEIKPDEKLDGTALYTKVTNSLNTIKTNIDSLHTSVADKSDEKAKVQDDAKQKTAATNNTQQGLSGETSNQEACSKDVQNTQKQQSIVTTIPKALNNVLDQQLAITVPHAAEKQKDDDRPSPEYIYIPLKGSIDKDKHEINENLDLKENLSEKHFSISTVNDDLNTQNDSKEREGISLSSKYDLVTNIPGSRRHSEQIEAVPKALEVVLDQQLAIATPNGRENVNIKNEENPQYIYIPLKETLADEEEKEQLQSVKEASLTGAKETVSEHNTDTIDLVDYKRNAKHASLSDPHVLHKIEKTVDGTVSKTLGNILDQQLGITAPDGQTKDKDVPEYIHIPLRDPSLNGNVESGRTDNSTTMSDATGSFSDANDHCVSMSSQEIGAETPAKNNDYDEDRKSVPTRLEERSIQSDFPAVIQTTQIPDATMGIGVQLDQAPGAPVLTSQTVKGNDDDDVDVESDATTLSVNSTLKKAGAQAQALGKLDSSKGDLLENCTHLLPTSMEKDKRKNAVVREKNMEEDAATKIQASFRGYQVRKQLKLKNGGVESINRKRSLRRKSSGKHHGSEKVASNPKPADLEEKSATKIQAGIRGFLVRRRQQKKAKNNTTTESS